MDLVLGVRLFVRGAVTVLRTPRLLLLGAIPALIVSVLYVGALATLVVWLPDLAAALTPFADGWSETGRSLTRIAAGAAIVAAAGAVAVVTFVAVTLAVGGPFYERLAEIVDDEVGAVPAVRETSWVGSVARGARDGLLLVALSVLAAIPLFLLGLVPVVGPVLGPAAAALVGGRLLMIELTAPALQRRGLDFRARRRLLRTRRAATWGVGVPTYLLAAIPFVAILAIPAASAAATLLARELRGEPIAQA
ncbi:EI24 domain-containing protein [Actinomycetospora straminea]|uniref:EI24 domain-containing protein n=1 Tax=Actinomycetospora straminea TaxID=663607 RepID=A0ABP9EQU7_9PSEU|nr:EI24 domain-containing protein [Actinomycetospora straminea]MDD7933909.1 EI24 domain-containing protein [Actinomycetospora straminea]